jgi:fucose permease
VTTSAHLLPTERKRRLAFAYYAVIFLEGTVLAAIGPALDALQDQSGSTTGRIALLFTATSLGYIVGSLAAGRFYGRVRGNLLIAAALMAAALISASIPVLGSFWLLIAAFALNGAALGCVDVGSNTLLVWMFRERVPPYMNTLHLAFGVGAFLSPLIIDRFAVATGDATTAYWLLAALMVPVALVLTRIPEPESPGGNGRIPPVVRSHRLFLGLMILFFFMHVGAESILGGWVFSYADDLQIHTETAARVLNSAYWGGLVLGRLAAIPLSIRLSPRAMLWLDLLAAGIGLGLIALFPESVPALWIGTIVFGAAIGPVFAGCINYTGQRIPITGPVTSTFLIGAGLGSMTLPWVVGQFFERQSPRSLLWLFGPESMLWVTGAAMVVGLLLFAWMDGRVAPAPGFSDTGLRTADG